jgi:Lon protease-like protein
MFPLGSVVFPGMPLSLQVFEPRYLKMLEHCLASGTGFGVVLIDRGSEVGGGDTRSGFGTLVTIEDARPTPDGVWKVIARGTSRIRVHEWLEDAPYPRAGVSIWDDDGPRLDASAHMARCIESMADFYSRVTDRGRPIRLDFSVLSADPIEAGWQLCAAGPVGDADRQKLLGTPDLLARLELLNEMVIEQAELLDSGGSSSGGIQ